MCILLLLSLMVNSADTSTAQPYPYYGMHPNMFYYGMAQQSAPMSAAAPVPTPAAPNGTAANPYVWRGATKAEVQRQDIAIAQASGSNQPVNLVPHQATNSQMWWCRELDGSYTLRNTNTIQEALQPGYWAYAPRGGYPYFIRQKPA